MAARVVLCAGLVAVFAIKASLQSLQDDIALKMNQSEVLSRKRRYLVFPEGSSLQLVYCLTIPSLGMGNIFTLGSTAALAWELPHDPFADFRQHSELLHRIDKPGKQTSGGWTVQRVKPTSSVSYMKSHYNPFNINKPSSSSYSTLLKNSFTNPYRKPSSRFQPVTTYLHPVYHKVYRRTRRDLYSKMEKLFKALSKDGRACLLKAICEVSKASSERGTFMEEIIKAIFRVRHHEDTSKNDHDHYDEAANKQHNCTEIYPSCENSIWTGMFSYV